MKKDCSLFNKNKLFAFTLAEVLITLTVIGIVAAIVIPSLATNVNDKAFNTQRKALYSRFSNAIPLLPQLNGYGKLTGALSSGSDPQEVTTDTATESFIIDGLTTVMKIKNVCYNDNLADCGFPETFTTLDGAKTIDLNTISTLSGLNDKFKKGSGSSYEQLDTKAAAFETVNGESIIAYYNPNCQTNLFEKTNHFSQPKMCANFIYDLNGTKAPNTVGKDIGFISVLYALDPVVVAPMPFAKDAGAGKQTQASALCKAQDSDARVPDIDELSSVFYNINLLGTFDVAQRNYWSSSVIKSGNTGTAWSQGLKTGTLFPSSKTGDGNVRCVRR